MTGSRPVPAFRGFGGPPARSGVVHVVGSGPGDVGALTLRAATLLATCDVVAHDRLAPAEALDLVPPHAERVCVGRRAGAPGIGQDACEALLVDRARDGLAVVRLKGGDPFVFGRGGEEVATCTAAGVPVEVVPGVTSPVAVAGAAGIPVTHRGVATGFAVVTGHEDPTKPAAQVDRDALARFPGTVVVLMGLAGLARLADDLVAGGRAADTPAAVVQWGTTTRQRTVTGTLATIAADAEAARIGAPAIVVVGEVVGLRTTLTAAGGREDRPLHGTTVALARTSDAPSRLAAHLRAAGAAVREVAVARTAAAPAAALTEVVDALRAGEVDTLVVTAAEAFAALVGTLPTAGVDLRVLAGVRVWATGARTAARLRDEHGIAADAAWSSPAALVEAGPGLSPDGLAAAGADAPARAWVLTPAGAEGGVPAALRAAGARVAVTTTATTEVATVDPAALRGCDVVLVPSSRAAAPAVAAGALSDLPVVSFGPTTTAALRAAGARVDAETHAPTPEAAVAALRSLRVGAPAAAGAGGTTRP
ncbi:MAG: uroporphyrinogen-III C-methyltransferase [Actinomycetes bacterium]